MTARRLAGKLETVWVEVPASAMEAYESAFESACGTVGFFLDEDTETWRVEGVRQAGDDERPLLSALAIAALLSGVDAPLHRAPTEAEGWLDRTRAAFPEQAIGHRFAIRGTHETGPSLPGRITLTLDAGVAFGSGEHGSTRGCLRALELVARRRRPARIVDIGTGSGILAMAAARLFHRPVLATDIDPWSVRVTRENAAANGLSGQVRPILADGWRDRRVRAHGPYELVFANILARPLCRMARDLAENLAPGGTVILAGLLDTQARMVLAAHRAQGLRLITTLHEGRWATLVLSSHPNPSSVRETKQPRAAR